MEDTGALLRFVQRSNDVDLREGELTLRTQGRYSELVALYQQRGQHEAALNLLHTLTLSPQDLPTPPSGCSSAAILYRLALAPAFIFCGFWTRLFSVQTLSGRQAFLLIRACTALDKNGQ